jgi:hypothetical protein
LEKRRWLNMSDYLGGGGDAYALLGKHFEDLAVQAFMGPGMKHCFVDIAGHLACPLLGVWLVLDGKDRIRHVTAYLNPTGFYRPYAGPLPFGLARGDRRAQVISKLGRPDTTLTDDDIYTSRSPRISVSYYPKASPKAGLIKNLSIFFA